MGRKEHPFVWYYNKNLHFAELLNGWLFHGGSRLTADDISDSDRRILMRKGRKQYRDRYRDLCKRIDGMVFRLLVGVEHQEHVHYAMPVRVMDYDSSSYSLQKDEITGRHEKAQDLEGDEFLSGFSGADRLLPVVSLILYCGSRPWDGALRLHELLDFERIPPELKECVMDYSIHVLDICHTSDERLEEFPPDIRTMFLFIKYKDDPDTLMQKLKNAENVYRDTCEAIADLVGERRLKKVISREKGDKVCMCKAIDILVMDGEKRGERRGFERGELSGFERGERSGFERGKLSGFERGAAQERKNTELERKNVERQKKNVERQRKRAEKAEARVRELERMLKL